MRQRRSIHKRKPELAEKAGIVGEGKYAGQVSIASAIDKGIDNARAYPHAPHVLCDHE